MNVSIQDLLLLRLDKRILTIDLEGNFLAKEIGYIPASQRHPQLLFYVLIGHSVHQKLALRYLHVGCFLTASSQLT